MNQKYDIKQKGSQEREPFESMNFNFYFFKNLKSLPKYCALSPNCSSMRNN
jgi:hypothetical protein